MEAAAAAAGGGDGKRRSLRVGSQQQQRRRRLLNWDGRLLVRGWAAGEDEKLVQPSPPLPLQSVVWACEAAAEDEENEKAAAVVAGGSRDLKMGWRLQQLRLLLLLPVGHASSSMKVGEIAGMQQQQQQ